MKGKALFTLFISLLILVNVVLLSVFLVHMVEYKSESEYPAMPYANLGVYNISQVKAAYLNKEYILSEKEKLKFCSLIEAILVIDENPGRNELTMYGEHFPQFSVNLVDGSSFEISASGYYCDLRIDDTWYDCEKSSCTALDEFYKEIYFNEFVDESVYS